jgi:PAS domain S-box-containing protein
VWSFLEDREGNVWVIGDGGIDRFREYSVATLSQNQGVRISPVFSVVAPADGTVRFATPDGLDIWDQGKISVFRPSDGAWDPGGPLYGAAQPKDLFQDRSGRIWVSTLNQFGYLDSDRFVRVDGYPGGIVNGIAEGPPGHLWVANQEFGLLEVLQGKVVQQRPWRELGFEQHASSPAIDPATNGLWLGFWNGGIAYITEGKVKAAYSVADGLGRGKVRHLHFDSHGTLWAATDGGLSRIENGHISTLDSHNGLPCDTAYWTIEDDDHALWLYMSCGLVRIGRDQLDAWEANVNKIIDARVLGASDGVWPHFWAGEYWSSVTKARDGKIWFVNSVGISVLDPHHLVVNRVPPPVHIEQLIADNRPYNPQAGLRLPSRIHYLAIDYTALSLAAPEAIRFRYRLEDVDSGWREVVNERKVQYSNLSPGHYRFRVIAANNSGVWNYEGDTIDFDILPAWYQTVWFYAACTAVTLLLFWWAHLLRVRHLRNQERKLRDVVDTIPTFVWTALPDGSVDFANYHWEEFSGLSAEKTAGSGWLEALHPEDRNRHAQKWGASVLSGQPFEIEVRFRRANGEYRWFLVRAVPMRETRGKITKWFGTTTDIEDRKRSELLRAELAHVNRVSTMGELLASISHELKQPITASALNASTALLWLQHDPPNVNAASELTGKIIKASKLAGEIIDRLRSLYKKTLPKREPLALNEVIGEMIGMLRAEAAQHGVSIRTDLADNLSTVSADRVQIQQVLMNLMLNGIEAMSDTGGVLTVTSQSTEGGQIQSSVIDTGPGLPPADAIRIFEPFFTTKPQGSGMGLAISKSIVESHGGRIWAHRNSDRGATFHFTLPAAPAGTNLPIDAA